MSYFFFGPRFSIYKMEVLPLAPQGYWEVLKINGLRIHQRMFWLEDLEFKLLCLAPSVLWQWRM